MADSKFKVGQPAYVSRPQIGRGGFRGMLGLVKEIDVMGQPFVKVLMDFSASGSEDQWFVEDELSSPPANASEETLEQKRDRLKAELAVAEAELHLARKPQASKMSAGTAVRYIDPATSLPAMDIKQGHNQWLRASVTKSRENYMPVTQFWSDFDVQGVIDKAWDRSGTLDIYPGKE